MFTTELATVEAIVLIRRRTVPLGPPAIRVMENVIVGIPAILKIIVAMTGTPALRILAMEAEIVKTLTHVLVLVLVIGREAKQAILITPVVFVHNITHSVVPRIANIVIPMVQVVVQAVVYIILTLVIIVISITVPAVQIMERSFNAVPQAIIITVPGHNVITIISVLLDHVIDIFYRK